MNRLVFIFAIFAASSAQSSDKSFLVIIIHHFGELSGMFRCLGTMISDQHVLTAASCVNKTGVDHIYLHLNPLDSALSDTSPFYYFDEVFTYPETESDDQLAILKLTKPIPEDVLDARSVNAKNLTSLAICDTYGWGGNRNKIRKITNSVLNADECSFQSSAKNIEFCTVMSPTLCSFWYGSPVFCGGQDISGILLPGDCNSEGFYRVVKLNEYENWIKSVTGSSKMIKPTVANLLMSSFLLILIYSCYS